MSPVDRSSSSAAVGPSTRSSNKWECVCEPMVTSPVATASASEVQVAG